MSRQQQNHSRKIFMKTLATGIVRHIIKNTYSLKKINKFKIKNICREQGTM